MLSINEKIAMRLQSARESSGLTQEFVATKMDLKRPSISEIESGNRKVSAEELVKFANLYEVDLNWLSCIDETEVNPDIDKFFLAARKAKKSKNIDEEKLIEIIKSMK